jgi:predicted HicB family RNase H-like nuclease
MELRKYRAMTKPPARKTTHSTFVNSSVRLPPDLHQELQEAALLHGRSMNAEIIARLEATPVQTRLDDLVKGNAELKRMVKQLLDK